MRSALGECLTSTKSLCRRNQRAQRGFYIFGNAVNLCKASPLWFRVAQIMSQTPRRVGDQLPLTCTRHGQKNWLDGVWGFRNSSSQLTWPRARVLGTQRRRLPAEVRRLSSVRPQVCFTLSPVR